MDHAGLIASVRKAAGNTVDQPDRSVCFPQQQRAGI
jgi:hypothetical protein